MDFLHLINKRQSVRKFTNHPIATHDLLQCIEAARLAPSASNGQPWSFIITQKEPLKTKLAHATWSTILPFNRFVDHAPVIITIVMETTKEITRVASWLKKRDFPLLDAGITAEHLCLQATELGIGTCMLGWFNERKVKKILNIPSKQRIAIMIAMGYPPLNYSQRKKIRKPMEAILHNEQYTPH